ncbi:hypothetical protein GCM10007276_14750 [Agaricicola taiwanensis]|uniref:Uncharacterized protein n=1 Tax=Agaricicola taiwanensis TaxID=591372 RepID=A0A8J2VS53_9RHOB|nr:hypothetical protein [Agaricicola taiwanensis]GGE38512.1 hypothetical protein GCM10007276_14750 [Agaricicola taiwanensis]
MIELDEVEANVIRATIFEDKCTENPRKKFKQEVLRSFGDYHNDRRCNELVACAVALIKESDINGTAATKAAARVLDRACRSYRASLTVSSHISSAAKRAKLFKDYEVILDQLNQDQRVAAIFTVDQPLRDWFDGLAGQVLTVLSKYEGRNV